MAKIVPSERLRRELDEVLAGVGEHDDPVEAVARMSQGHAPFAVFNRTANPGPVPLTGET